jgi:hypothetical protein
MAEHDPTSITLKEYLECRIRELTERLDRADARLREHIAQQVQQISAALTAALRETGLVQTSAKEAITKAEQSIDRRLDLLNEFRAQAADESRKYAQTAMVDAEISALEKRITRNETSIATLQGRALALVGFGALFGGAVSAIIVKMLT